MNRTTSQGKATTKTFFPPSNGNVLPSGARDESSSFNSSQTDSSFDNISDHKKNALTSNIANRARTNSPGLEKFDSSESERFGESSSDFNTDESLAENNNFEV